MLMFVFLIFLFSFLSVVVFFFFFKQKTAYEMRISDWSSDVCSSDLWMGGFAVSIHGIEPHLARFKNAIDDYSDILLKALADRLAEAFAERLHHYVRTALWGYAEGEQLTNEALIKEQYRGIRPAPGYPACPEHSLDRKSVV